VKSFASAVVVVSALLFGAVGLIRAEGASPVQPDNTRINARDRGQGSLTAGQQSEDKGDLELTRRVRKAVVADKSLSMLAKNVKIVSVNGIVTLRGPVSTSADKSTIVAKAQAVAGPDKVNDQIEVKSQQ
jgi:hyperosmotically inducible protein